MYKKMLVLLDGSELSETVFDYARQLAGRLKLDLDLLHVCGPEEAAELPMRRGYMEHMAELMRTGAEQVSSAAGVSAAGRSIQAQGSVVVGDPAVEILKYLEQHKVDLVMMSNHGHSGSKAWGVGHVTNQVVRASRVPVWLVPTELSPQVVTDTLPKRTLAIPLDGSRTAEAALPHAITVATQRGAESELVLIHVHDPSRLPRFVVESEQDEALAKMQDYLEGIADNVREAGFAARTVMLTGDAGPTIVRFLKENPPQLIAMATRAQGGAGPTLFGSVTQHVLELITQTPILLVSSSLGS